MSVSLGDGASGTELSALERNGLRALLAYAADLRHGAEALPSDARSNLAIVALQGGVAVDAVSARGRLLDALDEALLSLDRGWDAFVERALAAGPPDPHLAARAGAPSSGRLGPRRGDHRALVASLDEEGRDAYRAVVAATPVPRLREHDVPHLPLVARIRAGGGAAVAYGLGRLPLGRALAAFGSLSIVDWAGAQHHVRAERIGGALSASGA